MRCPRGRRSGQSHGAAVDSGASRPIGRALRRRLVRRASRHSARRATPPAYSSWYASAAANSRRDHGTSASASKHTWARPRPTSDHLIAAIRSHPPQVRRTAKDRSAHPVSRPHLLDNDGVARVDRGCVVSRSECQRLAVWKVASDSRRMSESAGDSGDCLGDGQKLLVVPAPSDHLDAERDAVGVDPRRDDHHGTTADLGKQQGYKGLRLRAVICRSAGIHTPFAVIDTPSGQRHRWGDKNASQVAKNRSQLAMNRSRRFKAAR